MPKERIALLGATGSIGTSALSVLALHPGRFELASLACAKNVGKLVELCRLWHPDRAVVADESLLPELRAGLLEAGLEDVAPLAGEAAVAAEAARDDVDTVVLAVVGAAGLRPSFTAARAGKRMLLANKESVVCAGELLMREVASHGATLIPVDSEHSAVFQCLQARARKDTPFEIVLTCSGGPFRTRRDLSDVKPEDALAHPTWSMGGKITIDSATLMNKGLEVIEASHLFACPPERIKVVVHPQSVIHSLVRFEDGCSLAQLGLPDMRSPIAFALGFPERMASGVAPLRLEEVGSLSFEAPDVERFPLLKLAYEALSAGDGSTVVLNAANEIAVEAFLKRRLSFTGIFSTVAKTLSGLERARPASLEEVLELDLRARAFAQRLLA